MGSKLCFKARFHKSLWLPFFPLSLLTLTGDESGTKAALYQWTIPEKSSGPSSRSYNMKSLAA